MNFIEIEKFYINLDKILYVEKISHGDLYICFEANNNVTLTGKEAEEFAKLLRKNGDTLERAVDSGGRSF
jgi:hypothetical protein